MQLNTTSLVDRYNRPSVTSRVALRTKFLNNGAAFDPYDISACTIFNKFANTSPTSIVDATTNIIKSGLSYSPTSVTGILMNFEISGNVVGGDGHDGIGNKVTSTHLDDPFWFPAYAPGFQASGIHRVGVGDYVAVLDGVMGKDLSGGFSLNYAYPLGVEVQNGTSATAEYIDVWTVKMAAGSDWQIFINEFSLQNDSFINLTEPLIINASNRLHTKRINVGTTQVNQDLVISTELTVGNRNLTPAVKNILQDVGIRIEQIKIHRIVEGPVPSAETYTTSIDDVEITSDNTILYHGGWATTTVPGTYTVSVWYSFLDQKLKSDPMYFIVQ